MTITSIYADPAPSPALLQKITALHDAVQPEVVERVEELHGIMLALAAGKHCFFLGNPGTAKSFVIDRTMARISAVNHFHILLGNFSAPADIEGPEDISGLREGRRRRLPTGFLPWANTAFLDEGWKANDSILNSMLAMLNERKWRNDGAWVDIPLSVVFIASNELPASENLNAIYDRISLRYETNRIQEPANFQKMLNLNIPDTNELEPVISWDDILQIQREVRRVIIPQPVIEVLTDIRRVLYDDHSIEPSDRRFRMLLPILQAEAYLDGCAEVDVEHCTIATNVLWDRPEQRPDVESVVLDLANPLQKQTNALLHDIQLIADIAKKAEEITDSSERMNHSMEAHGKIKEAYRDILNLNKLAGSSKARHTVQQAQERVRTLAGDVAVLMGGPRSSGENMLKGIEDKQP